MRARDLLFPLPLRTPPTPASFGMLLPMTRRKKSKFKVAKEARRRARLGIGLPPPERVIIDKRLKPPKHKKPLAGLLDDSK
jgi:hypothetical protein